MMSTVEYLDAVKARLGVDSDYAAAKALGVTRATISRYRTGVGSFDDEIAFLIADILDVNPLEVIIASRAERSKNLKQRDAWEGRWEKFSQSFRSLVLRADARQMDLWPV